MQDHDQDPHYSTQPQPAHSTSRYSGTSSAFSASANPNEDWTKISDLAERRRIQNRIAQRNYRKKLKKRLEDLERRAASSSVSPEPKPAELHQPPRRKSEQVPSSRDRLADVTARTRRSDASYSQYLSAGDGHQLFSQQVTRQLSTSPPPFTYSAYTPEPLSYAITPAVGFSQVNYGGYQQTCAEVPLYSSYLPTPSPSYSSHSGVAFHPVKQETYTAEDDINPFNMTFASMAGLDVTSANSYTSSNPQTPPLLEAFELSSAPDSPPDSLNHPLTPALLPSASNLSLSDDILNYL